MPRGRFLSKEISLDEKVNSLPDDTARLLFTWLIPHLDCEGRSHGDATTIKSIVFPRRKISVRRIDKYLNAIEKLGLILRYSVNGNAYLLAPHFEKHQVGLQKSKEAQSQIPPPPPELLQSNSQVSPPQVKVKVKDKEKDNSSSIDITNIYKLFEQEIGLLTPMIAEQLKDAESVFPDDWIKDAIKEAARANVRKWNYIEGILKNWATQGRDVKVGKGTTKHSEDPDKYVRGKYGHMVRRK